MLKFKTTSEEAMLQWGVTMARYVNDGLILFLYGELGAGKTTLTRGLLRGLGWTGSVKSPTYTLVEAYDLNQKQLFHFDLYRIKQAEELDYMGIQDYFTPEAICVVEWPEHGKGVLPVADLSLYLTYEGETDRQIQIEASSSRGTIMLEGLAHDGFS